MADLRQSKQMVFMWCKDGLHDQCRTQYGGDRIVCSCPCGEGHGSNYKPISKTMTEEEVRTSIASLNSLMVGDVGGGVSENRAVQSTSSVWGDQVKEGNSQPSISGSGYNKTSYKFEERLDAATVEELEKRRNRVVKYDYSSFDQWD